jgi:hypothetical protein
MPLILPPYVGKPDYYKRLSAGAVGANSASAQPFFPSAGSLSLPGARLLRVYGKIWLDHGTTSHTTALVFGGTLTVTSLSLVARHHVLSPNNTATFYWLDKIVVTTEHQTALLEHNLTSQQELWNKRAELEKIQLAIKTKLNTRPL